jgi:formate dehydrogenase subunit gamma
MRGALSAMQEGYVDDEWAAEHHELWFQDIREGKIPAQRTPEPQPAPHAIQP